DEDLRITVFTTRPDTLYGATYMVLAPEHPLVDRITTPQHRETIEAYRQMCAARSERDRLAETKDKTGVFTGAYAINPINDERIPIYFADYVLMGYGTGAIMAVPAHDQRDFEFAQKFDLPIRQVVAKSGTGHQPVNHGLVAHATENLDHAFEDAGVATNSPIIDGQPTEPAQKTTVQAREPIHGASRRAGPGRRAANCPRRASLFRRHRSWGEPLPILLDDQGPPYAVDEDELPVTLPELKDFKPTGTPQPPLSKAT